MTGDEGQIKAKRDAAARARRLANGLVQDEERRRMLALADELDAEAEALEHATPPAPGVTQMQMQVQQGPPEKKDEQKDDES